jgi:carbamoyl-phosphate synthase large subunit
VTDARNVLISSAGRRPYLVRWFREAAKKYGAKVIVADHDVYAASQLCGDAFENMSAVTDPRYDNELADVMERRHIGLAISVNDFELSHWASLPADTAFRDRVISLDASLQAAIEDKSRMATWLATGPNAVRTPPTYLCSVADRIPFVSETDEVVLKGRLGSGSRGLWTGPVSQLDDAIGQHCRDFTDANGRPANPDDVLSFGVIQPKIHGTEYGLDIVCDLDGGYAGVLVRRKMSMRTGETDKAITVAPDLFDSLARRVATLVPHHGTIDLDVIVDESDEQWVIDINPRFGGGYPFSHIAGANIPACYLAWLHDERPDPAWLTYRSGVRGAKSVGIERIDEVC